ncbi:sensor histidine kinase [Propioniferax innocua]|uniref:histidine kinase n=1 Tax=Propioniferax innocua TaxID=1753 RepID=A0A542ZQB5_9ACTN|nr:sensor histidine kinase [Propioniferax innocua]TQL62551.1 signal transduction histidine kinase [Propioniferax innocua]
MHARAGGLVRGDAALAAVLAVVGAASTFLVDGLGIGWFEHGPTWSALGSVILAAPLAFRRRWPIVVLLVVAVLYGVLATVFGIEMYVSQVVLFLSFYTVGASEPDRRRAHWVRVLTVVGMALWLLVVSVQGFWDPETGERGVTAYYSWLLIQWGVNIAFFGAAWLFGDRAWQREEDRQQLLRQQREIIDQQDELARNAVDLERLRIARELHDVVAHHVTAMGIQAGAARRLLDRDREAAAHQLGLVEESSRDAIGELHQVVRTLRGRDDGTEPLPGIEDVENLVTHARDLGQDARFEYIGAPVEVSPTVGLSAYRIVQEGLTNARKHAGPTAEVTVRLRFFEGRLEVEVSDDGRGARRVGARGMGVGITGMKERAEAVGGTLEAGPKARGGWLVRATLPGSSENARVESAGRSEVGHR